VNASEKFTVSPENTVTEFDAPVGDTEGV